MVRTLLWILFGLCMCNYQLVVSNEQAWALNLTLETNIKYKLANAEFQLEGSKFNHRHSSTLGDADFRSVYIVMDNAESLDIKDGSLYLFVCSEDSVLKNEPFGRNGFEGHKEIGWACVDISDFQLFFETTDLSIPNKGYMFEIINTENNLDIVFRVACCALLLPIAFLICQIILKRAETKDPDMSAFAIRSGFLRPFKEMETHLYPCCSICYEDFEPEDAVRILKCAHVFHPQCVDRWLIAHCNFCPYCREEIEVVEN